MPTIDYVIRSIPEGCYPIGCVAPHDETIRLAMTVTESDFEQLSQSSGEGLCDVMTTIKQKAQTEILALKSWRCIACERLAEYVISTVTFLPKARGGSSKITVEALSELPICFQPSCNVKAATAANHLRDRLSNDMPHFTHFEKHEGCDNCGKFQKAVGNTMKRCGGCRAFQFCSKQCQLQHWKEGGHKSACPRSDKGSNSRK